MSGDADPASRQSSEPVRIPLSNAEFEGDNNAYLFDDGDETLLVDPGIATNETHEELVGALAAHGRSLADVDAVFVTHWHADHAGLAGAVQAESGATVYAHPGDAPIVAQDEAAMAEMDERTRGYYEEWGMPDPQREALTAFFESSSDAMGRGADVTTVEDGDVVEVAGARLEVVHLPGHTVGLVGLAVETPAGSDDGSGQDDGIDRGRTLLTGDALLPVYTPNVGGADVRVERPLETYLDTLDRIAEGGYRRALPGHRDPIEDPAARAREIAAHHEERARRVLEALDRVGPADAWTVGAELFGGLEGIHILHGPGEAYAHLDHLTRAGYVRREGSNYRLAVDPAGIAEGSEEVLRSPAADE